MKRVLSYTFHKTPDQLCDQLSVRGNLQLCCLFAQDFVEQIKRSLAYNNKLNCAMLKSGLDAANRRNQTAFLLSFSRLEDRMIRIKCLN